VSRQVRPEQCKPHVKQGANSRGCDDVGAVEVQEDLPDGQQLGSHVRPHGINPVQEGYWVKGQVATQDIQLGAYVGVALLAIQ
jgi:hypothetical protein